MPSASDKFRKLSRRWVGQVGSAGVPDAVTQTIPLSSVTNLPTDTAVVAVIDRVDANGTPTPGKEETVIGVVSGSNLSNSIRGAEGTAQSHNAAAVVEILVTARGWNDVIDGLLVSLNPNGTPNFIDTDGTLSANSDTLVPSVKATRTYITNNVIAADGWTSDSHTWTYNATDGHTFTVTVNADLTGIIQRGDRIKFTNNSTTFKGIVSKTPTVSSGTTTLILYGGQNYSVANSAITNPFYSHHKCPFGFDTNPLIWSEELNDTSTQTQSSPAAGTVYNVGSLSLAVPIGVWKLLWEASINIVGPSGSPNETGKFTAGLSSSSSSFSDNDFVADGYVNATGGNMQLIYGGYREKIIALTSKTPYYLNMSTSVSGAGSLILKPIGTNGSTIIRAVSALL